MARESAQSYNPAARRYGVGLIFNLSLKDAAGYVEIENEASSATRELEGSVLKASQARTPPNRVARNRPWLRDL